MGGLGSGKWRRPGRKTVDSYPALDANYLSIKGWLQPGRSGACQFFLGSGPNSEVIQISLRAEVDHLCLSWRVANTSSNTSNAGSSDGSSSEFSGGFPSEREGVIGIIPIVRVPSGFVGKRAYFVCPGRLQKGGHADDAAATETADDAGASDAGAAEADAIAETADDAGVADAGSAGAGGRFCGRRVFKLYLSRGRFLCRHCSRLVYASKYEKQSWQRASRRANKLRRRLGIAGMNVPKKPHGMPASVYKRLLEATLQAEMQAAEAGTARLLQLAAGIGSRRRKSPQFTL